MTRFFLFAFGLFTLAANAADKTAMLRTLDTIQSIFKAQYAPAEWKRRYAGWELEKEIEVAKARVKKEQTISIKQYHRILKGFFETTRDYHVSVQFAATEASVLPFQIKGVNGKYYFVYINRDKLPSTSFPFEVGDELVEFAGKPTAQAIAELLPAVPVYAPTDHGFAELFLTARTASQALPTPEGPVVLKVKRRGETGAKEHQVIWFHFPEQATEPHGLRDAVMAAQNPFSLAAKKSFIPDLGKKVWESAPNDFYYAYLFVTPQRRLVGYIRIPTFQVTDEDHAKEFAQIISKFQDVADGLVIDQINNPGGQVYYLYALVSMLTDYAVRTPRHRIAITQTIVTEAQTWVEKLRRVENDADAQKVMGRVTYYGFPVDYQYARFALAFDEFIIEQWKAGKQLTDPYHLEGVDYINPHPATRFTKPILVLINEMDTSGGDFFPAILQDNKRATLFGARTAGAGGLVDSVTFPNLLGLKSFTVTQSIAERVDTNPIENLGVKPDIEYSLTDDDLQNGFKGYVKAVLEAVNKM